MWIYPVVSIIVWVLGKNNHFHGVKRLKLSQLLLVMDFSFKFDKHSESEGSKKG